MLALLPDCSSALGPSHLCGKDSNKKGSLGCTFSAGGRTAQSCLSARLPPDQTTCKATNHSMKHIKPVRAKRAKRAKRHTQWRFMCSFCHARAGNIEEEATSPGRNRSCGNLPPLRPPLTDLPTHHTPAHLISLLAHNAASMPVTHHFPPSSHTPSRGVIAGKLDGSNSAGAPWQDVCIVRQWHILMEGEVWREPCLHQ